MKSNPLKYVRTQPRLFTSIALGFVLFLTLPGQPSTRALAAWDGAAGLYLLLAFVMMARSSTERIRRRAEAQDEGQAVILGLITVTALVSLAGVMIELTKAKSVNGHESLTHVLLAAITVALSWSFVHTIFAVHYAHEYYAPDEGGPARGLVFPGNEPPDYWDFAYYSFVIGTSCATSDVDVNGRRIRRTTALHCVVSFFFNTTILALMVNIGASFF